MKVKKLFLKQIDKAIKNNDDFYVSEDIVGRKYALGKGIEWLEYIYVTHLLPIELYNIIFDNCHKNYNLTINESIPALKSLIEVIEFQYHYQLKFINNINDEIQQKLYDFIDQWKNEHISYSDNMIIVNKKYYEEK